MSETTPSHSGLPEDTHSQTSFPFAEAIFKSLLQAPILIGTLPESSVFDRSPLVFPDPVPELNFHQKLGHLCEEALAGLLHSSPGYQVLETNLPVRRNQHDTLGELDFLLLETNRKEIIHLELATKYYLAVQTDQGMIFPGPDARDHYHKKLNRLRQHQLTLAQRHREHLPEIYRHRKIVSQHLVLGILFDHASTTSLSEPEYLDHGARRGRWIEISNLRDHFDGDTPLLTIPKPLWLATPALLQEIDLETFSPIDPFHRCQMVLAPSGIPYFVTPDGYPNHQGAGIR